MVVLINDNLHCSKGYKHVLNNSGLYQFAPL